MDNPPGYIWIVRLHVQQIKTNRLKTLRAILKQPELDAEAPVRSTEPEAPHRWRIHH